MQEHGAESLITVQYEPHLAEYAWEVRRAIHELRGKNFVIAVDLPHGLEKKVLNAVKKLPRISFIIDSLKRGIPVIPTSAPIEAVRSYLEYGQDLVFVDTSFPVCTTIEKWESFQSKVSEYGMDRVITHAEEMGIDLNAIMGIGTQEPIQPDMPFSDLPAVLPFTFSYPNNKNKGYFSVRQRVMAMRLRHLLSQGQPVLFICNQIHYAEIIRLLSEEIPEVKSDNIIIPARTCRVKESDISSITSEIPYIMYLYETYRDYPVHRESWIQKICSLAGDDEDVETIQNIVLLSRKIALSRGKLSPDLSCLNTASSCCTGGFYTTRLGQIALSYPPADERSNCRISAHTDYNLQKIPDIHEDEFINKVPWDEMDSEKMNRIRERNITRVINRIIISKENEQKAYQYVIKHYRSCSPGETYGSAPFLTGIGDGISIRETIRNIHTNQIYIQNIEPQNNAAYVFDFGGEPKSKVYFYRRKTILGMLIRNYNHYVFTHVVMFARRQKKIEEYVDDLLLSSPLVSSLNLALDHSDFVYLFTNRKRNIPIQKKDRKKIKVIPLSSVPKPIRSMLCEFYSTGKEL